MAELKTQASNASVDKFLAGVKDEKRRQDCLTVAKLMQQVTNAEPKMWGSSIVGFGQYHYKYASGQEGDWFQTGFAPRKDSLTLYIMPGVERFPDLLKKLGKHKTGRSCLYIKSLTDIDQGTLKTLVQESIKELIAIVRERKAAKG